MAAGCAILLSAADLKTLSAEPDLVKRTRLALTNGERAVTQAGDACRAIDYEKCVALLTEIRQSVELAKLSLDKTDIVASRNPRHHKDAEIRTRTMLRHLEALGSYVHPDDRTHYEAVRRRVSEINDQLLSAIMSKRKK